MNEPDWSKAPEWANYHAVDQNGDTYWYENKPSAFDEVWNLWNFGKVKVKVEFDTATTNNNWRDTLQEKPEDKS